MGCGHQRVAAPAVVVTPPAASPAGPAEAQVTGVWDWVFRANDDQGNLRVEQEEWHLVQRGTSIEGYYDRALTLLSLDDQLFRCNQQLGITKFTRVRVAGSVEGQTVRVQELGFDARPGPCDDGARSLNQYVGEVSDGTLHLQWADRPGEQTLFKRPRGGGPRLAEMVGLEQRPPPRLRESSPLDRRPGVPLRGVFTWDLRAIDAEGDQRSEHEEWHLDEQGGELRGYYLRRVERVRETGVFPCSTTGSMKTDVRYEISGHRTGDELVLTESGFTAEPGKCETNQRRLDTYRGSISDSGNEIILSWGSGNQVLRRVHNPQP